MNVADLGPFSQVQAGRLGPVPSLQFGNEPGKTLPSWTWKRQDHLRRELYAFEPVSISCCRRATGSVQK